MRGESDIVNGCLARIMPEECKAPRGKFRLVCVHAKPSDGNGVTRKVFLVGDYPKRSEAVKQAMTLNAAGNDVHLGYQVFDKTGKQQF